MKLLRTRRALLSLLLAVALPAPLAYAQSEWPNRPVRILVPSAAGGSADFWARFIGKKLSERLGQPFVIENQPGAFGSLVTTALAKAQPDGYTLGMSFASALVPTMTLRPDSTYTWKDLQPIGRFGSLGSMLVVMPKVPARTLGELVTYIKSKPGELNYATYGMASGAHIAMEALKKMAGLDIMHVPYPGSQKILTEMQGGLIDIAATDPVTPMPFLQAGAMYGIAVNGPSRLPGTPDVPTMAEEGYPIFMPSWYGFFGPKETSKPVVDRLNAELGKIMSEQDTKEMFKRHNTAITEHLSPEEFSDFIASEVDVWGNVIREAGITTQ